MIEIKDLDQLDNETSDTHSYCILFGKKESPTCLIMQTVLKEVCKRRDYKFFYLDISIKKFYKLILEYNVITLPHYIFINKNDIICEETGTTPKRDLISKLKKLEE